jgi:hypothetical protein
VLVDSGSSASFIGAHVVGIMPGVQALSKLVKVRVIDGGTIWSKLVIPDCKWLCSDIHSPPVLRCCHLEDMT